MLAHEHYINRLDQTRDKLLKDEAAAELIVEQERSKYIEASD
jgi:flagellar biosynthesis chaperone FliJ